MTAHPPNTTEESSQNSDMCESKSLSPPTSVSEISADLESRHEDNISNIEEVNKMEVDQDLKEDTPEVQNERLSETTLDIINPQIEASQDSSQITTQSEEVPIEEDTEDKVIPRLVNTTVPLEVLNSVDPENWTTSDVSKFLTVNDCQPYCINFAHITGAMMLQLSKDEIIELLEMKVGPSLKIFDLIQQLKCKIKQPQCRMLAFK